MTTRTLVGRHIVRATSMLSRRFGLGGGSMIGGRVGLLFDHQLLTKLAVGRAIVIVTGTNGKTTTTRLLTETLGGPEAVATSSAGANMPAGLVAALCESRTNAPAVLEVDENYVPLAIDQLDPQAIVLLNLSRDQLDRVSEVRMIAAKWRSSLSSTRATVIANADDPLVVWAASLAPSVLWVGAGNRWRNDAFHCPSCDRHITYLEANDHFEVDWSCQCGFSRPEPDAGLDEHDLWLTDGQRYPLELALPGRFNRANAVMAAVAASSLGVDLGAAVEAMSGVVSVAGRFSIQRVEDKTVRLLLAKNPAGWNELIDLVVDGSVPVVIAINARDADGNDPSWLWDVAFERLSGRFVYASGSRRLDLAVRLRHAGVEHVVVADALQAIAGANADEFDFIGNYTAFQSFRRRLRRDEQVRAIDPSPPGIEVRSVVSLTTSSDLAQRSVDGGVMGDAIELVVNENRRTRYKSADLTIVNVHPDLLGTYGDGGNARVLANRALWRDITVEILDAGSEHVLPTTADIYCLGGGEDGPQLHSAERLRDGALTQAVERGACVLAICAGFQIIGESFTGPQGDRAAGVSLIDVTTTRGKGPRAVGEVQLRLNAHVGNEILVSGFENHAGQTTRGPGVEPFGVVIRGHGNGVDHTDGASVGKVIASYLHGPLLARNPAIADLLLAMATGKTIESIDDDEEKELLRDRLAAPSTR